MRHVRIFHCGERLVDALLTKTIRSMQFDYVLFIGRKIIHKDYIRVLITKNKLSGS
jgi:adenine-specific DNA methylase